MYKILLSKLFALSKTFITYCNHSSLRKKAISAQASKTKTLISTNPTTFLPASCWKILQRKFLHAQYFPQISRIALTLIFLFSIKETTLEPLVVTLLQVSFLINSRQSFLRYSFRAPIKKSFCKLVTYLPCVKLLKISSRLPPSVCKETILRLCCKLSSSNCFLTSFVSTASICQRKSIEFIYSN